MDVTQVIALVLVSIFCPCCCICCLGGIISNKRWVKKHKRLNDEKSQIVSTDLGNVEYSIKGSPPYVLCLHGTPGMHDGEIGYYDYWLKHGFGVIAPSRGGFARTDSVQSFEEQADQCAMLLDKIGVKEVATVYGTSGGGPCAIHFAGRHP
jgi:2-hydroxy-6-oxonona-2,4-dienedioate hydrolase